MTAPSTADLLIELGVEELPDQYLSRALTHLPGAVSAILEREKLVHGPPRVVGTPRRIAIQVPDLALRQPDETKSVTGPPEKVALDPESGKFTRAALKFAQKFGAGEDDLEMVEGPKGPVAGLTVRTEGKQASQIVATLLPEIFSDRSIPFNKAMYWGAHTGPFIRPVHWLVVMLDDDIVDATFIGASSGRTTAGHRFHAPGPHEISSVQSYEKILQDASVVVDQDERRAMLMKMLSERAEQAGSRIVEDQDLVDEVVYLTENPVPVLGTFDERFLLLPEQIVITAMAVHQRYFALRDGSTGRLANRFIAVANTRPHDEEAVVKGFERVLTARLEDAKFCHDEDLSRTLSDLVPNLGGMVFQARLGTYLDKTERLVAICPALLDLLGDVGVDEADLVEAARLCKADLLTKVVYEFPELQGSMGGVYAGNEGAGDEVASAIRDHYRPEGPGDELPESPTGKVLALADKLDTLAGFFALGKRPKGGSDPFGLRRACLGMVRIILALEVNVSITEMVKLVYPRLSGFELKVSAEDIDAEILSFLAGRLKVLWKEDARADILDATLECGVDDVLMARRRLDGLAEFQKTEEFKDLAVAFKRAYRIVKDAEALPERPDSALMDQDEEKALYEAVVKMESQVTRSIVEGDFRNAFNEFRRIRGPVDSFFEKVFVNVDDQALRANRLAILAWMVRLIEPAARLDLVHFERTKLESP